MMHVVVAAVESTWSHFMAMRHMKEVNLVMRAVRRPRLSALLTANAILFKTRDPGNALIGAAQVSDYRVLPAHVAWKTLGESSGVESLTELCEVAGVPRVGDAPPEQPIGCLMLKHVEFLAVGKQRQASPELDEEMHRARPHPVGTDCDSPIERVYGWYADLHPNVKYGPSDTLGSAAFEAVVHAAYRSSCAISGISVTPTLRAIRIVPDQHDAQLRVDNGLLLRSDLAGLYEDGLIGVTPGDHQVVVSRHLGARRPADMQYRSFDGMRLQLPRSRSDRPNADYLRWHLQHVFRS